MKHRRTAHQPNERLNVHGDLGNAKGKHTETTTGQGLNCQPRPHVKRSKWHGLS